jgi:hypothetical protein
MDAFVIILFPIFLGVLVTGFTILCRKLDKITTALEKIGTNLKNEKIHEPENQ